MIQSPDALRPLYPTPTDRALRKSIDHLDAHCREFLALSPFVVLATSGADGRHDASPRGGAPGFVRIVDAHTLWLPDAPGNNRLDSLANVAEVGRVGMLVLVPGIDETLRVNGTARVRADDEALATFADERRPPRVVLEITVEEAYLHCAKALMRSQLWNPDVRQERSALPPTRTILSDHTGVAQPPETQAEMVARYAPDL